MLLNLAYLIFIQQKTFDTRLGTQYGDNSKRLSMKCGADIYHFCPK